jgi:outer membrane protein
MDMRRRLIYVLVTGMSILSLSNLAQARDLKIGVVNMQRAVSESKEGKAAEERLLDEKKKKEAELNRKLKEFYAKEAELRKSWTILKEADRQKKAEQSQQELQNLQKLYLEAERELMAKKTKVMMQITDKLSKVIQQIAKKESFDYIFANAAVLWAPLHVDLTNEVIRRYNNMGGKN